VIIYCYSLVYAPQSECLFCFKSLYGDSTLSTLTLGIQETYGLALAHLVYSTLGKLAELCDQHFHTSVWPAEVALGLFSNLVHGIDMTPLPALLHPLISNSFAWGIVTSIIICRIAHWFISHWFALIYKEMEGIYKQCEANMLLICELVDGFFLRLPLL